MQSILALFGVHAGITVRKSREHVLSGSLVCDSGGAMLKICDSQFLAAVAQFMVDGRKRDRIFQHASGERTVR